MLQGLRTVIYRVEDLAIATEWYTRALEREPYFEAPFYVGYDVGGYELGLLPTEGAGGPGTRAYWGVPDADAAVARLVELGAIVEDPVADVGDGIRLGTVRDVTGNVLGVIYNPHFKARG